MEQDTSLPIIVNGTVTGVKNRTLNVDVQSTLLLLLLSVLNLMRHFKVVLLPGKAIVGI